MGINLQSIVNAKRKQTQQEHKFLIASCVIKLTRAISKGKISLYRSMQDRSDRLEEELDRLIPNIGLDKWVEVWIRTLNKELGDPGQMALDNLKQHAKPYWNPTVHKINIFPLGIVKSISQDKTQVEYYSLLEPGEQVAIPLAHTLGGKHSSLKGVAPQLQPLYDSSIPDEYLEVRPITYVEWCAFGDAMLLSKCCNKMILWSETHKHLVCQRCHEKT